MPLVLDVYNAYAGAPKQFQDFSNEILSLHTIISKVEDQLGISGSRGTTDAGPSRLLGSGSIESLSEKDKNDLQTLYNGLQTIMKELDDLLKKYQSLESGYGRSPVDRLRWGQEDLVRLRDKLRLNITMLTAFNASLAKFVPSFPALVLISF